MEEFTNGDINRMTFILDSEGRKDTKLTHKGNDFYFGQRGSEGPKRRHKQNDFYFGQRGSEDYKTDT